MWQNSDSNKTQKYKVKERKEKNGRIKLQIATKQKKVIVTKLNNSNCEYIKKKNKKKHKLWQNSQINWDKTQIVRTLKR